jgi:SET domain-containing protein
MAFMESSSFIKSVMNENVEFSTSSIHGNGLFAKSDIKRDTVLHVTHVHKELVDYVDSPCSWVNLIPNNQYNHSKEKENCKVLTEGLTKAIVTTRDISAGEELLVDYTKDTDLEQPRTNWSK